MYFVFSTSESFAHWASSSLQTSPKVNSGFSAMILGRTSPTKLLKGYSKGHSSSQVVLVLYRALSLCFASLHVRLTHESAARVLVSLRCSKITAATSTPGSKENLPSSWWVCDMRSVRGEVLSRGLFRGALLLTLDPRKTGTGEEQYPNPTARRAVDALTRAAGSHRSLRAAVEHVHTVPAPRGVAGRTSRHERRAGLHEPAGRVRIGHHRRIDDSGRRRLRVVPDASLAPRAVDLTAGRRAILAQVRIDQVRGQTRTEPRANGGSQSKVEGAAIAGPTISQNRL